MITEISELAPLWLAYIFAATSPGPATFLVIDQSTFVSRRHGVITALGVSLGTCFWVVGAAFGFQNIIQPLLGNGNTLSLLSIALLVFFGAKNLIKGIQLLNRKSQSLDFSSASQQNQNPKNHSKRRRAFLLSQVFAKGFLINVLNPNALVFFLSLFAPLMITHANSPTKLWISIIGVMSFSIFWYQFLAAFAAHPLTRRLLRRIEPYLKIGFAMIYAFFAFKLFGRLS